MTGPSGLRDRPWFPQFVITVASASQFGTVMMMGTVLSVLVGYRGTPFEVSLVLTAYFVGLVFFAPVWGALADITGRRRAILLVSTTFATLSVLPLVFVHDVRAMLGVRLLSSVFSAGYVPVMLTIVNHRGGAEKGRSLGLFNSSRSAGATTSQLLSGFLLGSLLPETSFLVLAAFSSISAVAVVFLEDPTPTPETTVDVRGLPGEVRSRLLPTGSTDYLTQNGLQWLFLGITLRNVAVMGVMSLMPIFLVREVAVSEITMGVLLALGPATQVVSMYGVGVLSDRIPRKPLISLGIAGTAFFPLFAAASPLPEDLFARQLLAAAAFLGKSLPYSLLMIGSVAFIGDVASLEHESELMGLRSTFKGIGGIVGPALNGLLATQFGFSTAFVVASALALAGAVIAHVGLVETNARPTATPSD